MWDVDSNSEVWNRGVFTHYNYKEENDAGDGAVDDFYLKCLWEIDLSSLFSLFTSLLPENIIYFIFSLSTSSR